MLCGWRRRRTSVFERRFSDESQERWCRNVCQWGAHSPTVPIRWHLATFPSMPRFSLSAWVHRESSDIRSSVATFATVLSQWIAATNTIDLLELDFQHFYFRQHFCFALHPCARHGNESEHLSLIESGAFRFLKAVRVAACEISIGYGLLAFFCGWIWFRWNVNAFAEKWKVQEQSVNLLDVWTFGLVLVQCF